MKKLIIFLLLLCLISLIPMTSNFQTDVLNKFAPMSLEHPFGTDHLGRDVLSLMLFGFQRTIQTVFSASLFSLSFGLLLGFIAGYKGGVALKIIELISNLGLVIPSFIVALIMSSVIGFNPISIGISLGIFDLSVYAMQVATLTQKIKSEDFITMAQLTNVSTRNIFRHHIFIHVFPAVGVLFASKSSSIILRYAALAFIGLGADVTKPDWGMLLYEYRIYFLNYPSLLLIPTIAIFILCLSFQLLFDNNKGPQAIWTQY